MDCAFGDRSKKGEEIRCTRQTEICAGGNLTKTPKTSGLRQLASDLLGTRFLERDCDEASMSFQDHKSALRFGQISAEKKQNAPMPRREGRSAIECPAGAGRVGVIIDRRMERFVWPARSVLKALIGVSPAGVQHGEPGERREVHRS